MHSGEVVAGVVGHRTPRYFLLGNAVNITSPMEIPGIPGHVCVTESQSFRFALEKENGKSKKEKERLEVGAQNKWKIGEEVGARKDPFFSPDPSQSPPPTPGPR